MNDAQKFEYRSPNGIYIEQLEARESAFEVTDGIKNPTSESEEVAARKRIKELSRKDEALAEAAALLVLSKKVQAIWGMKDKD